MVQEVAGMGFAPFEVREVINELAARGERLDVNMIIDRLTSRMAGGGGGGQRGPPQAYAQPPVSNAGGGVGCGMWTDVSNAESGVEWGVGVVWGAVGSGGM